MHIQHRECGRSESVQILVSMSSFLTSMEGADQRLSPASLVSGQTPSCSLLSSSQLNLSAQLLLFSFLSSSSTLTNFSIEETAQAGPDTGVPDPPRCLTAPVRRAPRQPRRLEAAVLAAGQPRGRGAERKSRLGWGGSPGLRARSGGLPRSGPEAPSYGGTQEVSGQ